MKCLKCGAEYEDSVKTCADCHVPLVPDNYDEKKQGREPAREEAAVGPYAKHASVLVPFVEQLEAMGFVIGEEGASLSATHPQFDTFLLTEYENGIIFELAFKLTEEAKKDRLKYLEFVNQCNNDVPVMRASARNDEEVFVLDTWIPGNYDKDRFDAFMRLVIAEVTGVLFQNPDFKKFLEKIRR